MCRMLAARGAVLLQLHPVPVVNLIFVCVVVAALALGAGQRNIRSFI